MPSFFSNSYPPFAKLTGPGPVSTGEAPDRSVHCHGHKTETRSDDGVDLINFDRNSPSNGISLSNGDIDLGGSYRPLPAFTVKSDREILRQNGNSGELYLRRCGWRQAARSLVGGRGGIPRHTRPMRGAKEVRVDGL